jgi:hypothetical protein
MWIAAVSTISAASTFGLFLFAVIQVISIRASDRKWATIRLTNVFDVDPVLHECTKAIRRLSHGQDYSFATLEPELHSVLTLLNYFASLAIGIEQGIYVEDIVRDNLEENIVRAVDKFITPEYEPHIKRIELPALVGLRERWRKNSLWMRPI